MKNYFFLDTSIDSKITGIKDGMSQVVFSENFSINWHSLEQFMFLNEGQQWMDLTELNINSFESELVFQIKKGAKLTDLLDFSPFIYGAFLVSAKLKNILEKFSLEASIFKQVFICEKDGSKLDAEYFLMQLPLTSLENLDWKNSFFYKQIQGATVGFQNYDLFTFPNASTYLENLIGFECAKVSFKKPLDLDFVPLIMGDLVSEELKIAMQNEGITNVLFYAQFSENSNVYDFAQFNEVQEKWNW